MWAQSIGRLIHLIGQDAVSNTPEQRAREQGRIIYPHPYLQEWPQAPRTQVPDHVHQEIQKIEDSNQRFLAVHAYYQQHPARLLEMDESLAVFVTGLAGRRPDMCGDNGAIARKLIEVAGLDPDTWGVCPVCKGSGMDPEHEDAYENWEPEPPPEGPGYQLWENVSEGAPVSAVFPDETSFVRYLVEQGYSDSAAATFVKDGWAPSGVMVVRDGAATMLDGIAGLDQLKGEASDGLR